MVSPRPSVSVVVPAYRAEHSIERVVRGILRQTEVPLEVIVVSDGAVDQTPLIAARLAAEDPRVRDITLPTNEGVAAARDAGSAVVRGDYVLFADADDSMPDDAIAALVDRAVETNADVVIGGATALLPSGDIDFTLQGPRDFSLVSRAFAFRLLLRGAVTGHLWNKLVRREVLAACRPFPRSDVHSDLALTATVIAAASTVAFIDRTVYTYHSTPGSILKSGRSRLDSLQTVEASTRAAAISIHPGLPQTRDYRYFETRFINLSRVKDALLGPYSASESRRLVREAQRRLLWRDIALLAQRRDSRSTLMALSAKISARAHAHFLSRGRGAESVLPGPEAVVASVRGTRG